MQIIIITAAAGNYDQLKPVYSEEDYRELEQLIQFVSKSFWYETKKKKTEKKNALTLCFPAGLN